MKKSLFTLGLCLSFLSLFAQDKQPNILFIFSDDAGYGDFGFHGSKEFKTPNLDKFAKEGVLFKQAYVSGAVCGPSRAGLLTGKYQQKFGYEENNVPGYMSESCLDDDDMGLPLDEITMADYLKQIGYQTALFGKWHLGNSDKYHPTKRGFDKFYGFRGGARSYWPFGEENPNYRPEDYLEEGYKNFEESDDYLTNALADEAIKYMDDAKDKDEPFFVMLAFNAVHYPMDAEEKDLKKFKKLEGKRKQLAAMTLSMDRAIGKVLKSLDKMGIDENTIIIYSNDNGGPSDQNASSNYPLSGTKANHLEGGIRVPFIMKWPGVTEANTTYENPISLLDLMPTFYAAGGGNVTDLKGIDGVDLKPYVIGENPTPPHEYLYWKKENRGAIRNGDWKLLRFPDRPAALFNIAEDEAEMNDLASENPEIVKELYKKLFEWELTLERPKWQLQRKYEGAAMERMDAYWKKK